MHVSEATLIGSTIWDGILCVLMIASYPISPDHHRDAYSSKQFGRWRTCTRPSGQSTENPLAARQAIFVSRALMLFHVTHAGVSQCSSASRSSAFQKGGSGPIIPLFGATAALVSGDVCTTGDFPTSAQGLRWKR